MTDVRSLPPLVAEAWRLNADGVRLRRLAGGFSGADVFHCRYDSGLERALRCWPHGTSAARLTEVQNVLRHAREAGCTLVPATIPAEPQVFSHAAARSGFVTVDQRHWEMSQWLMGNPWRADRCERASLVTAVARAAAAVGRFHSAVRTIETRREIPKAVLERVERLAAAERFLQLQNLQNPPLAQAGSAAPRWIVEAEAIVRAVWKRHAGPWKLQLADAASETSEVQYVLRDVHDAHVLFDETDQVCGLLDFDALRVDTPAADMARLVQSFAALSRPEPEMIGLPTPIIGLEAAGGPIQQWRDWVQQDLWAAAVAGIRQHCDFSDQQWQLARLLADVTSVLALVNWMRWVASPRPEERRNFAAGSESVQNRVELLSRFAVNYFSL